MGEKLKDLEEKRNRVGERLVGVGDMRQGTLTERHLKCGKSKCRCAREVSYTHGPSFSLTKKVKEKTVTRAIPKSAVKKTRAQVARFQEFRQFSQEFLAVNEEICEAKLREPEVETDLVQKKTSRRSSKLK